MGFQPSAELIVQAHRMNYSASSWWRKFDISLPTKLLRERDQAEPPKRNRGKSGKGDARTQPGIRIVGGRRKNRPVSSLGLLHKRLNMRRGISTIWRVSAYQTLRTEKFWMWCLDRMGTCAWMVYAYVKPLRDTSAVPVIRRFTASDPAEVTINLAGTRA